MQITIEDIMDTLRREIKEDVELDFVTEFASVLEDWIGQGSWRDAGVEGSYAKPVNTAIKWLRDDEQTGAPMARLLSAFVTALFVSMEEGKKP